MCYFSMQQVHESVIVLRILQFPDIEITFCRCKRSQMTGDSGVNMVEPGRKQPVWPVKLNYKQIDK